MNKQILKKLSAVALAVAMLQGVALTSAISYSAVETEQVEASGMYDNLPNGTTVRWDYNLGKFVKCKYLTSNGYTYYVTDDGKGAVVSGVHRIYHSIDSFNVSDYSTDIGPDAYYYHNGVYICFDDAYNGYNPSTKVYSRNVTIPSQLDGLPVVELGEYVIAYSEVPHSVSVPSTVKTIRRHAFYYCINTFQIKLSEGIEKIEEDATKFFGLSENDSTYWYPNRKLVIPSSLKELGKGSFGYYDFRALVISKNSQLDKNTPLYTISDGYQDDINEIGFEIPGDVLIPDDFDITNIVPNKSYIYYTEKNNTFVEYANSNPEKKTLVKLELNNKDVTIKPNEILKLRSNLHRDCLINSCTWQSSDTSVATVDEKGNVTAVGLGTATITMTTENEMQASCTVRVSGLAITKPDLKVGLNQKYRLKLNQTDVKGTWSSSDTSVATVNKSGNVTSVGVGKANIVFTAETGERTVCVVRVVEGRLSDLGLNAITKTKFKINGVGRYYSLIPSKNTQVTTCSWESTNEKVVTVNKYGNVKSVGVGTADIVVTDAFGQTKTYKFTVC